MSRNSCCWLPETVHEPFRNLSELGSCPVVLMNSTEKSHLSPLKVHRCIRTTPRARTCRAQVGGATRARSSPVLGRPGCSAMALVRAKLFTPHAMPLAAILGRAEGNSIQRCDYTGYHADDMTFPKKNSAASTKIIPTGCASELGGVIAMEASGVSSTFVYTVPLKPRVSGLHTVFLGCGEHDGIFSVFIDPTKTGAADAEMDVEVPEISIRAYPDPSPPAPIPDPTPKPGPEPGPKPGPKPGPSEGKMKWLQSSAYLRQGQLYAVRIVYGNKVKPGSLRVLWLDTLSSEPETSFVPILP